LVLGILSSPSIPEGALNAVGGWDIILAVNSRGGAKRGWWLGYYPRRQFPEGALNAVGGWDIILAVNSPRGR
jgi:hypothetical protein